MSTSVSFSQVTVLIAAMGIMGASGCVQIDDNHCIFNGGDFHCDDSRICITDIDAANELSDRGDGCVNPMARDGDAFPDHFVYVQYGLPLRLPALVRLDEDLQSVTGILQRSVRDLGQVCDINEEVVLTFEPQWRGVVEVREHLDQRTRVREETAALTAAHVHAIDEFNQAINHWLEECADS